MATIANLATTAAATAAGYKLVTWTGTEGSTGAPGTPVYHALFDLNVTQDPGAVIRASGESLVSLAAAITAARTALNAIRSHHYAGAPGTPTGTGTVGVDSKGRQQTTDKT